ncbi:MAG: putative bifunctional diguanylate cyclase/phosphodiesterase, partial [Gammaproteobacteria bacterium]
NVFAAIPAVELAAESRRLLGLVTLVAVPLVVVPGFLVTFLINRTLVRPIETLRHAAARVRRGDFDVEVRLQGNRQISDLAVAFTDMSKGLKAQRDALAEKQKELEWLAFRDTLTGLPNRGYFRRLLEQALLRGARYERPVALLFIDLDGFKRINDTLGHDAGDELLRRIAARLRACVRRSDTVARVSEKVNEDVPDFARSDLDSEDFDVDTVARLGGDEFTVTLNEIAHKEDAGIVAQKIIERLGPPMIIRDQEVVTTPSIGIALFPDDGEDAHTLLRRADAAMYEAKREGKNRFRFYSDEMERIAKERMEMERRLRHAIDNDGLELHYQPLVSAKYGMPAAVEALVRWTDPVLGPVRPDQFIELAEDVGLIVELGAWVLHTAIVQSADWQRRHGWSLTMCINIAGEQLLSDGFVDQVQQSVADAGAQMDCLELELTERTVMSDAHSSVETLNALKAAGVRLAVDDFGTGYSSLAYLKRFPLDVLKVDRRFVTAIDEDEDNRAITEAIIAMARALRLETVAEGVETEAEYEILSALAVDRLQGWLFAKAMPAPECEAWINARVEGTAVESRARLSPSRV